MPVREMYDAGCYLPLDKLLLPLGYLAPDETRGRIVTLEGVPIKAIPEIRKIYFNNKHTTIEWADGEKTTVGCIEGQEFDEYSGFAAAVLKRLFGSSKAAIRYMDERKVVQPEQTKKIKRAHTPSEGEPLPW